MDTNDPALMLEARARRAYELGRFRRAARLAPFVLLAAGAAVACGRPLPLTALIAGALLPICVGLAFAGGPAGRGVVPGLLAGSAALAMPLLVMTVGHACLGDSCMSLCLPACVAGGAVAGAVIAKLAARHERDARFLGGALAVAGLMGALGCTIAGTAGVAGMLAGVRAAGAPLLVAARR